MARNPSRSLPTDVGGCEQYVNTFDANGQYLLGRNAHCRNMAGEIVGRCRVFDFHQPREQNTSADYDSVPGIANDSVARCSKFFPDGVYPNYVPCCVR